MTSMEDGYHVQYSAWGKKVQEYTCKDGKLHGLCIEYDIRTGSKMREFICLNGKMNGECIGYKNGKIKYKCEYKNDIENGKYTSYYKNDKIQKECFYIDGDYHNKYIKYNKKGKKIIELTFDKGIKSGVCIYYKPYLSAKSVYREDKIVKYIKYYKNKYIKQEIYNYFYKNKKVFFY